MGRREGKQRHPTRREFLYVLGGATGATITGWVLISRARSAGTRQSQPLTGPALMGDLVVTPTAEGADVLRGIEPARKSLVSRVNDTGRYVLEQMDGRKSTKELAAALAARLQSPPSDMERFESSIASFIAELGKAGMLREPFYVNIYNSEVTA